jgi:hypothetical protein
MGKSDFLQTRFPPFAGMQGGVSDLNNKRKSIFRKEICST